MMMDERFTTNRLSYAELTGKALGLARYHRPVKIAARLHPFRGERLTGEFPAGLSVSQLLKAIGVREGTNARVFLDDRLIMPVQYDRTICHSGQTLVVRALAGEGGRGKDVELITLAVAAVAAAVTAGAGALLAAPAAAGSAGAGTASAGAATAAGAGTTINLGSAFATVSLSSLERTMLIGAFNSLLTGAINFGGQQLINSLIPPPKTPVPKQETTPHSYTVSGTANAAAAFSPIPKIYGARRIFPQYAASPYNELVGFNQYLRMLFLLGYGPLDISQIKIGDTAIEDYEDVEWELRSGFPDDAPTHLYPGSVSEAELNIQLSKTNGGGAAPTVYDWSQVPVQTSGTNADELGVDVSFPGGLSAFAKSSGKPVFIGCRLQIRWAPAGTQNWTYEPVFVIKSTYIGTTGAGHVWRVPRGQYDVQATFSPFTVLGDDWSQNYVADGYWTALRTIRDQPPYTMAGLALLAVRIRATRQLSGAIANLNCVASSILPDYDSTTGLWDDRADGWDYDSNLRRQWTLINLISLVMMFLTLVGCSRVSSQEVAESNQRLLSYGRACDANASNPHQSAVMRFQCTGWPPLPPECEKPGSEGLTSCQLWVLRQQQMLNDAANTGALVGGLLSVPQR
jgi:hypothetical protein